jgi:hypothetical protein
MHIEPTVVLVPTRINDSALAYLLPEESRMSLGTENEGIALPCVGSEFINWS